MTSRTCPTWAHPAPLAFALMVAVAACNDGALQASLQAGQSDLTANLNRSTTFALSPNLAGGRCLTALGGAQENGTPVVLADCDGSSAQAFSRSGDSNGTLTLFGTKCLDVADGSQANGAKLQLWECAANNDNQQWQFLGQQVQWAAHSTCIDVTDGNADSNSAQMQLWACDTANTNQRWDFKTSVTADVTKIQ